ncbi:hypothetical protein LUZ60_009700 [Juncus effusus]|nr:hypothetical protein LUZ60_009700 [Juncus effusus]
MAETHSHTPHAMAYSFPQQSIPHQISAPAAQTSHTTRGRGGGGGGGEIVAVQGGHIVRSTGRKDRHSKVCTAKGPRDRRVRLSAHTAIQFYDVQDRLGYDRPSKAVDWLIKNAKDAIDKLAELPPWTPSNTCAAGGGSGSGGGVSTSSAIATSSLPLENQLISGVNPPFDFSGSLDSDAIADTIKSFFPMGAASSSSAQAGRTIGFQSYSSEPLSRSGSQSTQDLRLSLQSFQDSMYHNHHQAGSTANLGFNSGSGSTLWPEPNQRIMQWSMPDTGTSGGVGAAGYSYNMPVQAQHHHQASPMQNVLGQGQLFFQRGPLQSSNSPGVRSWADPIESESDHPMHQSGLYHQSVQSIGFGSGGSASFSGFRIPARIQGEEEEHDGLSDKPPASSHH